MLERVKQILKELLFLSDFQRERLIALLQKFSEEELAPMHASFMRLKDHESNFVREYFEKNPNIAARAETFVQNIEASSHTESTVLEKTVNLEKMEKLFRNLGPL